MTTTTRKERPQQFAARVNDEIADKLDRLHAQLAQLDRLTAEYRTSLERGSWRSSGDLGRINETLADVVERLAWVE